MSQNPNIYEVIILAGGSGTRTALGKNKMYVPILGKPLLHHTLLPFMTDPLCCHVILVIRPQDEEDAVNAVKGCIMEGAPPVTLVTGGNERQESTQKGLAHLKYPKQGLVLVHDGARPLISHMLIHQLVEEATLDGAATLAVPAVDTIKRVRERLVIQTLKRSEIWLTQTPQAFRKDILVEAMKKASADRFIGNEEGEVVERYGIPLAIVLGDRENIKVTYPIDFDLAETILKNRCSTSQAMEKE